MMHVMHHTLSPESTKIFCPHATKLLDIGAGIRPQRMVPAQEHICVEPHHEYVEILSEEYPVIQGEALEVIEHISGVHTYVLLDVIEHMEKEVGLELIDLMQQMGGAILIYTPDGFMPQEGKDAWGLNGEEWQRHRSGWKPDEFQGWWIKKYHSSFFAYWSNQ